MNISKNLATGALTFLRPGRDIDHIMLRLAHSALQWTSNHNPLFRPFVHNTTDNYVTSHCSSFSNRFYEKKASKNQEHDL